MAKNTKMNLLNESSFTIIKQLTPRVFLAINDEGQPCAIKYNESTTAFPKTTNNLFLPILGHNMNPKFLNSKNVIFTRFMAHRTLADMYSSPEKPDNWNPTAKSKIAYGLALAMQDLFLNHSAFAKNCCLITPDCIYLDSNMEPKISLLALESCSNVETTIRKTKGAIKFVAPELMTQESPIAQSCALYSFAVILASLIADGNPQFNSDERIDTYMEVKTFITQKTTPPNRFKLESTIPKALSDLIAKCWDPNSIKRQSFSDITRTFPDNTQVYFPGTNTVQMKNYIKNHPPPTKTTQTSKAKPKRIGR